MPRAVCLCCREGRRMEEKMTKRPYDLLTNFRFSLHLGIWLVLATVFSDTKGQEVPDLSNVHPIIQRMIDDRSKPLETLRATRFLPYGYDSSTVETQHGTVTNYYISPIEYYSFRKGKLSDINFTKFGLPLDSLDRYGLDKIFAKLGKASHELPSSQTDLSTIFLYPKFGLAFHGVAHANYYHFVEVFPPTTLRGYKRKLWNDPQQYVRDEEKLRRMNRRHERHNERVGS